MELSAGDNSGSSGGKSYKKVTFKYCHASLYFEISFVGLRKKTLVQSLLQQFSAANVQILGPNAAEHVGLNTFCILMHHVTLL